MIKALKKLLFLPGACLLFCCNDKHISNESNNSKQVYYEKLMKLKNFKLFTVGECDSDNVEPGMTIIDWVMNSKNGKVVQFKIAAGHNMEF